MKSHKTVVFISHSQLVGFVCLPEVLSYTDVRQSVDDCNVRPAALGDHFIFNTHVSACREHEVAHCTDTQVVHKIVYSLGPVHGVNTMGSLSVSA